MRQLRDVDHECGWEANWSADAVLRWCAPPRPRSIRYRAECWYDDGYDWRADHEHPRTVIEIALGRLRKKARRELRRLVARADDVQLARRLTNPFAPKYLPWWLRFIE
jgi:hypothetical protein